VQGLELSRRFYFEVVRPILDRRFPEFEHAAALIGTGSEVLGYDDETSRDHHWGPRLQVFVRELSANVEHVLAHDVPTTFAGFPTNFGPPDQIGVRLLAPVESGPIAHRVEVLVLADFLRDVIGVDPLERFTLSDWLLTPTQRLLEVTAGDVFSDATGDLTRVRELLAWYPHDVWLLVMTGHWRRVAQLEHLQGRAGLLGDELGARLLTASLVRDLMRLGLLQHRRYPPYPKWLGTAYAELELPERPLLEAALEAGDARSREAALVQAYEAVAERHNALGVTEPVNAAVRQFWRRPIRILFADRFVDALRAAISDPDVRAVEHLAGSIDAVSDNTDVLTRPPLWRQLAGLYDRS
jgi:Domain of unknown function (DUF4037)